MFKYVLRHQHNLYKLYEKEHPKSTVLMDAKITHLIMLF